MIEKEFVNYNQALALKELGLDEPCLATYHKELHTIIPLYGYYTNQDVIKAPLKQQVFRWFREKYKYHIVITNTNGLGKSKGFGYEISIQNSNDVIAEYGSIYVPDEPWLNTYEEAEDACIDKLIEIVKGDKNEK